MEFRTRKRVMTSTVQIASKLFTHFYKEPRRNLISFESTRAVTLMSKRPDPSTTSGTTAFTVM
jgi:hypothetical protein